MLEDLWEVVSIDVQPEDERALRRVPVIWKWEDFEISQFTEFDRLKVKKSGECLGRNFMDLNSAKQYVYRFLKTGGFPDAEENFKSLCNMTSFNWSRVYDFMKDFSIEIEKCNYDDEVFYTYNFEKTDLIKCESIYEVAGCLQDDFLLEIGFHDWENGKMRLEFIKKNTPQENINPEEQMKLLNQYNLRKHAGKW